MHDTTAIAAPQTAAPRTKPYVGKNANPRYAELYRHYPTIDYLRPAHAAGCRIFPLNIPMAARARTMPASSAIGRGSMRWNWCRAMA